MTYRSLVANAADIFENGKVAVALQDPFDLDPAPQPASFGVDHICDLAVFGANIGSRENYRG